MFVDGLSVALLACFAVVSVVTFADNWMRRSSLMSAAMLWDLARVLWKDAGNPRRMTGAELPCNKEGQDKGCGERAKRLLLCVLPGSLSDARIV